MKEQHSFLMTVYTEKPVKDLGALIRIRAGMLEGVDLAAPNGGIEMVPVTLGMKSMDDYMGRTVVGIPTEVQMTGCTLDNTVMGIQGDVDMLVFKDSDTYRKICDLNLIQRAALAHTVRPNGDIYFASAAALEQALASHTVIMHQPV